jgi:outer membrane protein assembly factor BamB
MSQRPPQLPDQPPPSAESSSSDPGQPGVGDVSGEVGNGGAGIGKARALVAAVVAAALALGAVGLFTLYGDGEKDSGKSSAQDAGKQGRELFKIKAPDVPGGESGVWLRGAWVTDEIYARTVPFGVVGMDPSSGKRKWKLPLDGLACTVSERVSNSGKTAVLMTETESARSECTRLVVFDVDSGKKEWQKTLRGDDVFQDAKASVTISKEVVAVRWGYRGAAAYKVSGGAALWKARPDSACVHESFAGGKELTAVVSCDEVFADSNSKVQKLDPETGKPSWEFKVPGEVKAAHVISSDPVIVQVGAEMMVIGENGRLKSTISLRKHSAGCRDDAEFCVSAVVDDKYLYIPSSGRQRDNGSFTNAVVAFDLNSGKPRWSSGAGRKRTIDPLRMEGGKLIAYKPPTNGAGGEIVAIDPAEKGRKQELRLRNPDKAMDVEQGFLRTTHRERPLYENGRLYLQWSLLEDKPLGGLGKYVSAAFGPR